MRFKKSSLSTGPYRRHDYGDGMAYELAPLTAVPMSSQHLGYGAPGAHTSGGAVGASGYGVHLPDLPLTEAEYVDALAQSNLTPISLNQTEPLPSSSGGLSTATPEVDDRLIRISPAGKLALAVSLGVIVYFALKGQYRGT